MEKALDLEIRKHTNLSKLHGVYLTEEPLPLYQTDGAKLYVGFELDINPRPQFIGVEFCPASLIRESVLDHIKWRRKRGASAGSIKNTLLRKRKNVILAPNGTLGVIRKVLFADAGSFNVPIIDVSLPEFWKNAYNIEVKPEEKPLLVVKPYDIDVELTYPPSCVFFDEQSICLKGSVLNFVEYKKSRNRKEVFRLANRVMSNLRIGEWKVKASGSADLLVNTKRQILNEIKKKLLGKRVRASGSVIKAGSKLYFLPKSVFGVY